MHTIIRGGRKVRVTDSDVENIHNEAIFCCKLLKGNLKLLHLNYLLIRNILFFSPHSGWRWIWCTTLRNGKHLHRIMKQFSRAFSPPPPLILSGVPLIILLLIFFCMKLFFSFLFLLFSSVFIQKNISTSSLSLSFSFCLVSSTEYGYNLSINKFYTNYTISLSLSLPLYLIHLSGKRPHLFVSQQSQTHKRKQKKIFLFLSTWNCQNVKVTLLFSFIVSFLSSLSLSLLFLISFPSHFPQSFLFIRTKIIFQIMIKYSKQKTKS